MLYHKLNQLKEKRGLTNQQIADKSREPISTVTRILNGQTENPSYQTIANMVRAMDGSLDAIEGIEHPAEEIPNKVIELYERMIERQRKYIKFLFFALIGMVGVVVLAIMIDVLQGSIGFIRY